MKLWPEIFEGATDEQRVRSASITSEGARSVRANNGAEAPEVDNTRSMCFAAPWSRASVRADAREASG